MKTLTFVLLLLAAPVAMAQSPSTSAARYATSEALSVHEARLGEVLMVRVVELENDRRLNAGSAVGAAVGYSLAREVGGDHKSAARTLGSLIGGAVGTKVQRSLTRRQALEIFVRDFSDARGRIRVIVQELDVPVRAGDTVFLVGKGRKTRVVPLEGQ